MALQSSLFAVSDDPAKQRALASQAAILATIQAAQSYNIGANVRLQWYDPDAARAWLDYARSAYFSREAINALPAAEQNLRVVKLWEAFGRYWQCLNVSPYGWARFRRLCEAMWGYPSYALGGQGWRGRINTPKRNGQYGGAWRQRAHAAIYSPPAPQGNYSPAFGGHRGLFYTGNNNPEFGPTDVVFGTPEPYAIENAGNRPGERGVLPNTNFAPTVEVHRVWMQRNGDLIGSYPDGLSRAYADANPGAPWGRTLAEAWQGYNFSAPPVNNPGRWDDWTVGFALPEVAQVGDDVQWTVPPLLWYWQLLRDPQALTTGTGNIESGGYFGFPEMPPVVMSSVLDYLASLTPEQVIREVMFDVMQRNAAMAAANGIVVTALGDAAGLAEIERQRTAAAPSTAAAILAGAAQAVGGVVSLATASPVGLAMGGMVSQAVKLIDALSTSAAEERLTDVFGRLMPTLDTVGIHDARIDATQFIGRAGLPSGGGGLSLGGGVLLTALFGANAGGALTIIGMPPAGIPEVGADRAIPSCRWTDASETAYRCQVPGGPQWVRVTSPEGESRLARTEAGPFAPATVTWSLMYPEHRYVVGGMPPATEVFVDGVPAMGEWADAAQTAWVVLLPAGPHAIRMVPPGGAPVLVEVMAQGAESAATWAQLVAAGMQQRVEAAQPAGSNAGWWLALAVALGAGGLFYATTQVSGGKRANPAGKRRR